MNKNKALSKIQELIRIGEDLLANKEYYDWNSGSGVLYLMRNASGYKVDETILNNWKQEIKIFLSNEKFKISFEEFQNPPKHATTAEITEHYLSILKSLYKSIDEDFIELENDTQIQSEKEIKSVKIPKAIFVGHGHNPLWGQVVNFLRDNLKCPNVIYFEKESRSGQHIGEILKGFTDEAKFAVIIMTAEDETIEDKIRARQNVIHEIGFFQGKLGFEKVAILKEDIVESFSNIDGFQYIEFSKNNIKQTFFELQEMLKREKLI